MSPAPAALVSLAATLLFKVTVVCAAAGALAALLRNRSAAVRHFVWLCALAGSVALLAWLPLAPRIALPMPEPVARILPVHGEVAIPDAASPGRAIAWPQARELAPGNVLANARPAPSGGLESVLAMIWLAGALIVLLAQLAGHAALRGLEAGAEPVEREGLDQAIDSVRRQLGTRAVVRVRASGRVAGPLTWGWRRAIVMLPAGWRAWSPGKLRIVLLHELAHVARADYAVQRLASLACAVYWFHPLVWVAASRLRLESELACDDCVLGAGTAAPEYAEELLSVARSMRAQRPAGSLGIGMARPSHLEGRLLAMLDEYRSRTALSTRAAGLTLAVVLLSLLPIAGLTVAVVSAKAESRTFRHSTPTSVPADAASRIQRTFAAHEGGRLELDLPAGATVDIQGWDRSEVTVDAQLAGKDWRRTALEFNPQAGGVTVHLRPEPAQRSYSSSHSLTFHVPRRYDVRFESAGGEVAIREVSGRFHGHTGGGSIRLSHLHGSAELTTGGGAVEVTDCTLSGSVTTGGGGVRFDRVSGGLHAGSGSGQHVGASGSTEEREEDERVTNRESDTESHERDGDEHGGGSRQWRDGGAIELPDAPHGASLYTGGGDIRVGTAGGDVSAYTGGGDIVLGPVAGSVKASTGAGLVHVTLATAGGRTQDVDVWTGSGRVILEVPRSLDVTFDLESAWTRSHGGPTKVTSDLGLQRSETTDWDSRHGTPRRYVRATGVQGSGRGHVKVRTVNGDIEVRRL